MAHELPIRRAMGSPLAGGLAAAAGWLSGAMLLGLTSTLFAVGNDGFSLLFGMTGGLLLGGVLVAPHLSAAGHLGVVCFLEARFGRPAALVAALVLAAVTALLFAAELKALTIAFGVGFGVGSLELGAATAALFLIALVTPAASILRVQALLYPLLTLALVSPLMLHALAAVDIPLAQFNLSEILQRTSVVSVRLLENELADPGSMKAYMGPSTQMTALGTALLTFSLSIGLACLPQLQRRGSAAATPDKARLMLAIALFLVVLAALAFAPLAATARMVLLTKLAGQNVAQLDETIFRLGAHELIKVCGVVPVSQEVVTAACAALPDAPTVLQLDDIVIARDSVLLAIPLMLDLSAYTFLAVVASVAVAAAVTAVWSLATLRDAVAGIRGMGFIWPNLLAALTAGGAFAAAIGTPHEPVTLLVWALALMAGGFAPALLAGIWSSRATSAAAILAMLAGFGVTGYYMVGTEYRAPQFYETWAPLSSTAFGATADYEEALSQAATPEAGADPLAALRRDAGAFANWWGLKNVPAGALGFAVGILALLLFSPVTPRPGPRAQAVSALIRDQCDAETPPRSA